MNRSARSTGTRHFAMVALLLTVGTQGTSATGFFINQQSVKGLGRVDAGNTVAADELGTIFFNPAGLPHAMQDPGKRNRVEVEGHLIVPRNSQRNRGSSASTPGTLGTLVPLAGGDAHDPVSPTPVPAIYYARQLSEGRGAIGAAVNAPFGLTTTFDPSWHGRYDATDASLKTYNGSLVAAYGFGHAAAGPCRRADGRECPTEEERELRARVSPRVYLGGGIDIQRATTSLVAALPNPLTPGGPTAAADGTIRTEGDAFSAGFNVGVLWIATPAAHIGVHYRSRMTHEITGTSTLAGLQGPLAASNGTVDARTIIKLPDIGAIGGSWQASPGLIVLGDVKWFNWSRFDEIRIRFADGRADAVRPTRYRDAWAFAGGIESPVTDRWSVRGGVHYDTTPTVDGFRDTTVPDAARLWFGAGATYQVKWGQLDLAFNHVLYQDTSIDLTRTFYEGTPLATTVAIHNDVSSGVNTIAASFRWKF